MPFSPFVSARLKLYFPRNHVRIELHLNEISEIDFETLKGKNPNSLKFFVKCYKTKLIFQTQEKLL